jgi:DNA-directed RNA polymerase beta' subunit
MGQRRPDVLLAQKGDRVHSHGLEEDEDEEASDDNMSEPESVSESVGMLDEEAVDEDERRQDSRRDEPLPRTASGKIKTKRGRNERAMSPEECRAHLRRLFRNEVAMCSLLYGRHGPFAPLSRDGFSHASADMFFLEVIPVAPTRFRPAAKLGETLFEHPQNELLAKVLRTSYRLRNLHLELRSATDKDADVSAVTLKTLQGRLLESLIQLQVDVNSFMDSNKNPAPVRQGKLPPAGVKQGLEKKEGLFRKHMMVCSRDNHMHRSSRGTFRVNE